MASLTLRSITNARVDALAAGDDIGGAVQLGRVIDETIARERVMLHLAGAIGDGYRVVMVGHGWSGWTIPSRLSRRASARCRAIASRETGTSLEKGKWGELWGGAG